MISSHYWKVRHVVLLDVVLGGIWLNPTLSDFGVCHKVHSMAPFVIVGTALYPESGLSEAREVLGEMCWSSKGRHT